MDFVSHSLEETKNIAESLARKTPAGSWLLLFGDLGSGKTTFTQYFAAALGVKRNITSPTFVIAKNYPVDQDKKFVHIDAYRLNGELDAESIGLSELKKDPSAYVVVEWPEKILSSLPVNAITLRFEYVSENERKISILS
ncbi:MAG: tRNA (adenosine(37)-N6)-threonylcarbamoyltransferase complex ATPase subunit type 1 TsaE [Candidatus Berkelbacteria bacterium]